MPDINERLVKVLKAIISDVESMQADASEMTDSFDKGYGPFSEFVQDGDDLMYVEWPNLDIDIEAAKQILADI